MINSLQSLRGIFAIMIFLHHFPYNGGSLFKAGGSCGVEFFLMLSGFVMCAGYEKRLLDNKFRYGDFILKRLIRVYPLHILCLLGFLVIHTFALNEKLGLSLIPNILLLQSWFPLQSVYFSGNAVSWCLSDLMFFYAVFPFLVRWIYSNKIRIGYFVIPLLIVYFVIVSIIPAKWLHFGLYIFPLTRLIDFFIGILLWQYYKTINVGEFIAKISHLSFTVKTLIELLPIAILSIMIIAYPDISERYAYCFYWWFPMMAIILVLTVFNKMGGGISLILNNKWLVMFGNVSFSFYMIHQLGISLVLGAMNRLGISVPVSVSLPATLLLIIFVSFFVYRCYETPVVNYLLSKIRR